MIERLIVIGDKIVTAKLKAGSKTIDPAVKRLLSHWGMLLRTRIMANASGRPGPNAPTGDYRRSWTMETGQEGGNPTVTVGTNRPQGRRLEDGFVRADSLGRVYNQPPFPHVGPAKDEIEPQLVEGLTLLVRNL